ERRAVRFAIRGSRRLIVPGANLIEQSLIVKEDALESTRDQLAQRCNRKMRFAGARLSDQQQSWLLTCGKFTGEGFHRQQHAGEARVGGRIVLGQLEIIERSVPIERRNPGSLPQSAGPLDIAARAALRSRSALALNDLPTGTAALGTNRLSRHD